MICSRKNWRKWLTLTLLGSSLGISPILAHGAKITYENTPALVIRATYDSGEPMKNAPVVVYAPTDATKPWLKGKTDPEGQFVFTPDPNLEGNWQVKVRQAGHGDMINIPLSKSVSLPRVSGDPSYTPLQKLLMTGATVWGFVGTALFFSRKKGDL